MRRILPLLLYLLVGAPLFGQVVVSLSGDQVTLNYGSERGVKIGITAFVKDTEKVGGKSIRVNIAKIQIASVAKKQAVGKIVQASAGYHIKSGQHIEFAEKLVPPPAPPPPPPPPDELIKEGRLLLDNGKCEEAIKIYRQLETMVSDYSKFIKDYERAQQLCKKGGNGGIKNGEDELKKIREHLNYYRALVKTYESLDLDKAIQYQEIICRVDKSAEALIKLKDLKLARENKNKGSQIGENKPKVGIEFIKIHAGVFNMGSANGWNNEKPVHQVRISQDFEIGKYEVKQEEWNAVMGSNPSRFIGNNNPVENVSWDEIQDFIKRLNDLEDGYRYRLPYEAEWEYAARAGSMEDFSGNLDAMAWYEKNSGNTTHPVGQKQPNAWGLYDMQGNVLEWIQDLYNKDYYKDSPDDDPFGPSSGSFRVLRGGGWADGATYCRLAFRKYLAPGTRDRNAGFRLLRTH